MIVVIRKGLAKTLAKTINGPLYVRHNSQSLYQSALGCLRMWRHTEDEEWLTRARKVVWLIVKTQRPDGGFDVAYDFNFGYLHRKGEAISPELPSLLALSQYLKLEEEGEVELAVTKALAWIERFSFRVREGEWAIPYGPYSCKDVVNYNGVSFACGALGYYMGAYGGTEQQREVYHGYIRYLNRVSSVSEDYPGRFWHYADQENPNLGESQKAKIDYYHQMQQVEMHSIAEQSLSAPEQSELIRAAADHITGYYKKHGTVLYTPCGRFFGGHIHTWGYCSVASGLLEAAIVIPERAVEYRQVAREVGNWLVESAYREGTFIPIITAKGVPVDKNSYVRTDAWLFNTMCALELHLGQGIWSSTIESVWQRLERSDFSGPENHARSKSSRFLMSAFHAAKKVIS